MANLLQPLRGRHVVPFQPCNSMDSRTKGSKGYKSWISTFTRSSEVVNDFITAAISRPAFFARGNWRTGRPWPWSAWATWTQTQPTHLNHTSGLAVGHWWLDTIVVKCCPCQRRVCPNQHLDEVSRIFSPTFCIFLQQNDYFLHEMPTPSATHPSRNGWEGLVLELLPLHEDDGLRLGILGADLLQAPSHRQQLGAVRPQLRRQRLGRGGGHFHLARA